MLAHQHVAEHLGARRQRILRADVMQAQRRDQPAFVEHAEAIGVRQRIEDVCDHARGIGLDHARLQIGVVAQPEEGLEILALLAAAVLDVLEHRKDAGGEGRSARAFILPHRMRDSRLSCLLHVCNARRLSPPAKTVNNSLPR